MTGRPVILDPPDDDPTLRRVRWVDELGCKRQRSFRRLGEAKAFRDQLAAKIDRGLKTNIAKLTVGELMNQWWDDYATGPHISEATRTRMYAPATRNWIAPRLSRALVAQVDRKTIDGFVSWMSREGAQPPTIRATLTTLSSIFQRAVEWDLIGVNPVRGTRRPAEIVEERKAYEPTEVYAIAAGMRLDRDRAMTVFDAFTGLRQAEVWGLSWKTIGKDEFTVYRPKLKRWDTVPLFEPARLALDWWREITPYPDGLIFPSSTGSSLTHQQSAWGRRFWRPGTVVAGMASCGSCGTALPASVEVAERVALQVDTKTRKRWACPVCTSRSVTGPEFHELRHTFGSLAVYATGDLVQAAKWMGHSDTKMLSKRYKHQLERGRERAVQQVNDLLAEWS